MTNVEKFLQSNQIVYVLHEHLAVYTCEEAEKYCGDIPGLHCKNLLLRDKKKRQYFLLVLSTKKRADLKRISETVEERVSFANPEELKEKMGLDPGAVSPFGLLNDKNHEVEVYIDQEVYNADIVSFHPNRNTASLELTGKMFRKFLQVVKNNVHVI